MLNDLRPEGVPNFRSLAGATFAGRRLTPGRLYRSGSLHQMTDAGRATLDDLGIRTVIDLRCEWERMQHPYRWDGLEIVLAPLVENHVVTSMVERFKSATITSEELEDWWNATRVFQAPEEQIPSIRVIFDRLLRLPGDGAVLIHCRGGKDRTGMVSAFVLDALGVRREDVMADFVRTNDESQEWAQREAAAIVNRGGVVLSPAAIAAFSGVRAEWLDTLFERVAAQYGSVAEYLAGHIGIGDRGVARLRKLYLEPI